MVTGYPGRVRGTSRLAGFPPESVAGIDRNFDGLGQKPLRLLTPEWAIAKNPWYLLPFRNLGA